jgi:carbamoyl-phosphate synthase large subunit
LPKILLGVVIQFGGQTPLNIAWQLEDAGVNILGISPETIDLAEDRDRFREIMKKLHIPMLQSGMARQASDTVVKSLQSYHADLI